MKIAKWIILSFVVVLFLAGLIVYLRLNHIVRVTVESRATSSLNLQTTLDNAAVSLFGGKLSLDDLKIASPQGFAAPKMFTVGGIDIAVNYSQLRNTPIHIASLTIRKPALAVEQAGGKLNVQAVMDQQPKDTSAEKSEPMKLIIDRLIVEDASVALSGIPGLDKGITVPVPSLELENIGNADGNQNGAAIKEVVMQVITALAAKGTNLGNLPEHIKQQLNAQLGQVSGNLSGEFQKQLAHISGELTKNLPADLGKQLENAIGQKGNEIDPGKALEKEMGGVLGNKEEKKTKKPATRP